MTSQAAHQNEVARFFDSSWALRQRFAVIDVEGMTSAGLNLVLDWVSRRSLANYPTKVAVLKPRDVPMDVAKHHMVPPDANSFTHASRTRERVEALLKRHGCTSDDWNSIWYHRCAKAITKRLHAGRRL